MVNSLESNIQKKWSTYTSYVHLSMYDSSVKDATIRHWRDALFIIIMTYTLPLSLFALLPSMLIEYFEGHYFTLIFDASALSIISFIVLNRRISLHYRRLLVSTITLLFSIFIIAFLGSFTVGYIYLFSLSIFVSTQFSGKSAFYGLLISFMVCLAFGLILTFELFSLQFHYDVTVGRWIIYSCNFLFINAVVVYIIYRLINDVEKKMIKESVLLKELKKQNKKLTEIAHLQSHVIRVPLANIMGLSNLIIESLRSEEEQELLIYFDQSIKQLDTIIQDIVNQTSDH